VKVRRHDALGAVGAGLDDQPLLALSGRVAELFSALPTNIQATLTKLPHHSGQERGCLTPEAGITSCLSNLQQAFERAEPVCILQKAATSSAWSAT